MKKSNDFYATFPSDCTACGERIEIGDLACFVDEDVIHSLCLEDWIGDDSDELADSLLDFS